MPKNRTFYYETEIAKIAGAIHRELSHRIDCICSGGRLTISHMVILELLVKRKSSNMSELSKSLNLTMPAATAIIDKMIELGLVKRDRPAEDRRIVDISLTKKGSDSAKKVIKSRHDIIKEVFSVMTEQEKKQYLLLLNKVYTGIISRKS